MMPVDKSHSLASSLLPWASVHGRRPPWREVRAPYLLGAAEVLLQKTRAEDVEPVWLALTSKYPTSFELARADDKELEAIVRPVGLGRQRTLRLKQMAAAMTNGHEKLPGVGAYGSAILRLAANERTSNIPVDGNMARVMTRYYGLVFGVGEPRKKTVIKLAIERLLATQPTPADMLALVYSVVDLGAAVCKPRLPDCPNCPLFSSCAFAVGGELGLVEGLQDRKAESPRKRGRNSI